MSGMPGFDAARRRLLALAPAGAAFGLASLRSTVRAETPMILSHTGVADYAAAYLAQDEGLFRRHGIELTLLFAGGATSVPGLQAGSIQMATVPTTTLIAANDNGLDMVAVAGTTVLDKTDTNVGLLVGTQSGVKEPKDLVGKKIAVPSVGGFLHVMARRWLTQRGVDIRKVGFVEVVFPQLGNVLKSGNVAAAVSADPFLKRSVAAGEATVMAYFAPDLPPQTTGVVYVTSRDWATKNEAAVRGFRASIVEAVALARADPGKARAAIGKYTKLPPDVLATLPLPHLSAEVTEAQLRFWAEAMHEQGLLKGTPDPAKLLLR